MRGVACLLACVIANASAAASYVRPRPPRAITADELGRLADAVQAEPFADGKLEQLRRVAGGRYLLFSGAQAIGILELFAFWSERLSALRLMPLTGADADQAVLRAFERAPGVIRDEARRILSGNP